MDPSKAPEPPPRRRLLYLVTEDWAFWLHRRAMAQAAVAAGWDVAVACRVQHHRAAIEGLGVRVIELPWNRQGVNPLTELALLARVVRVLRRERPDLIHAAALKPVVHGALAADVAARVPVVGSVEGLGYVFINNTLKARLVRPVIETALRLFLNRPRRRLVVQNTDDQAFFRDRGLVRPERIALIPGAGVDLTTFAPTPLPEGPCVITYVGRMLIDKGLGELIQAARLLRQRGVAHRLRLVGAPDPGNPASLDEATLQAWHAEGVVEYLGQRDDIPALWATSHVAVLPSYREGLPKSLLEAAACARPAVTTDVPGCRDLVVANETGLIVPARDAEALADALATLAQDLERCRRLGLQARERVARAYSDQAVGDAVLALYGSLTEGPA
ncbi:glycosyltransferase family 4 protein [Pararhodospirillum photometricum]|nr:glycosyltransferase family 4 protein [Pararhodospirillum photometricum]